MAESLPTSTVLSRKPTIRLFFALQLSPEVRAQLAEAVQRLTTGLQFTPVRMTWVPPEHFHVTLYFLGDVAETNARRLVELLPEAAASVPSFVLDVRHLGTFPDNTSGEPPKVLWAGVHNAPPALRTLRMHCASILARSGLAVPDQDFTPHVTLARFRSTRGLMPFRQHLTALQFFKAGKSPISELVLMRSITGGGPARYEPYATAPLAPAAPLVQEANQE